MTDMTVTKRTGNIFTGSTPRHSSWSSGRHCNKKTAVIRFKTADPGSSEMNKIINFIYNGLGKSTPALQTTGIISQSTFWIVLPTLRTFGSNLYLHFRI